MVLFINDRPIRIIERHLLPSILKNDIDYILLDGRQKLQAPKAWRGHIIVEFCREELLKQFFKFVTENRKTHFESIHFIVSDKKKAKKLVKSHYTIIEAAGGVIQNDQNELLMIYRLGVWDLPKGKVDKGETLRATAEREVMEECNIKVNVGAKAGTTWHNYTRKGKNILKKTTWYHMICTDDSEMLPQQEEDIEAIEWKTPSKMHECIQDSYLSIHFALFQAGRIMSVPKLFQRIR